MLLPEVSNLTTLSQVGEQPAIVTARGEQPVHYITPGEKPARFCHTIDLLFIHLNFVMCAGGFGLAGRKRSGRPAS